MNFITIKAPASRVSAPGKTFKLLDASLRIVIGKRLEVYEAQTKPLIQYYEGAGLLRVVAADADVDTVFKSIQRAVQPA